MRITSIVWGNNRESLECLTSAPTTDIMKEITYFYVVTAVNRVGESDYSNEVSIAIPAGSSSCPF